MPNQYSVALLVGSLRRESFSRKLGNALTQLAPESLELTTVEIGELPHYNEDLEASGPPSEWVVFRDAIRGADAVLFVTPEYNRSVPGVLKNAIDVGSRPPGQSVWDGRPGAVASITPYQLGAFGANHHLRQSMVFLNVPMMQQPEAYISRAGDLFDGSGALTKDDTRDFLTNFMAAFARWVAANARTSGAVG